MEKEQVYKGLTSSEVEASRRLHGSNILTPPVRESLLKRFLQTLTGPFGHHIKGCEDGDMLVFILELAALLSICISLAEYHGWCGLPVSPDGAKVFFEPAGIILAILLASGVGFLAEVKAEREFEILNQVNDDEPVSVIRNGAPTQIPRRDVVVGDVLLLSTGEEIPADAELLDATHLSVDESTLTGELMTHKAVTPEEQVESDATFPSNHVFRGTKVMEGHGVACVFAVGDNTENGKVFTATKIDDGKKTPLNEQFDRLGILITTVSCVVGVMVLVGRIALYLHGHALPWTDAAAVSGEGWGEAIAYLLQSIMIAVTLVVCAVPEGLPMAVTMALAYSMRRMMKSNNLVRKMHATETMGATTVICTDKTGTLTMNQMRVAETLFRDEDLPLIYLVMAVNSTAELDTKHSMPLGNPTEAALLLWLHDKGIDYRILRSSARKVDEEPFTTEKKYMSSTLADGTVLIKGAPEIVMGMCHDFHVSRTEAESRLRDYQGKAMRTLAFAAGDTFLGIVAISDPVRPEVPASIQECLSAGIKIKIVTGDAPETAREIYRQIFGREPGMIVLGSDLQGLTPEEIGKVDIIARARPMDKKHLVESLQKNGEVVAVTGDGTNDAPALKSADVGLSMGNGTSVAKEASDITIIDNSFTSIGKAVMWGRSLYRNIQRFILFQLTVNITACLVVMIGSFMTSEPPLTVTQMLWVNLIMDTFAAVALASLPPSPAVMNKPPRNRRDNIITRAMATDLLLTGLYFTVLLLLLLSSVSRMNGVERAVFFSAFIMLQFWNLFCVRYGTSVGKAFMFIATVIFLGQWFIVTVAYNFFNISQLEPDLMCIVIIAAFLLLLPKMLILLINSRFARVKK